jgi:hypothetical protein
LGWTLSKSAYFAVALNPCPLPTLSRGLGLAVNSEHERGEGMSRKDYQAFADALKEVRRNLAANPERSALYVLDDLQIHIMRIFAADNPRFDGDRFDTAARP